MCIILLESLCDADPSTIKSDEWNRISLISRYNSMAISLSGLYLNALTFRGQSLNDKALHWAPLRRVVIRAHGATYSSLIYISLSQIDPLDSAISFDRV